MSEETPKITTILKEKDPKRVEAGKRLAQLNKERKLHKEQQMEIDENKSYINYGLILICRSCSSSCKSVLCK